MAAVLLLLQLSSALLLLYVGLPMPGVRDKGGGLTRRGWWCLILGTASLILLMVGNAVAANIAEKRLHEKIETLTQALSQQVMITVPQSISVPPLGAGAAATDITIAEPSNGSSVGARHRIAGKARKDVASVWVIVHPVETGAYWVQPFVGNPKGGKWQVAAYFGRSGGIDIGREFEVMAIANPQEPVSEGRILPNWSEAEWRSEVIAVRRKG